MHPKLRISWELKHDPFILYKHGSFKNKNSGDVDKCHLVAVIPSWQVGMVEYQENNGGVNERGLGG